MTANFAHDLDQLISDHLSTPRRGDDLHPIAVALHEAAERVAIQANRYRWRNETEQDFRRRVRRRGPHSAMVVTRQPW